MADILKGVHCTIRLPNAEDGDARLLYLNMREIERMMLFLPHPYTYDNHIAFQKRLETDASICARTIEVNGKAAGGIGLHDIIPGHKATLGYWLAPHCWGKGVISEAISLFVAEAFKLYHLVRIQAYVFDNNPASCRVLEKNGFICEGRLRQDVIKDNQVIDRFIYSKLAQPGL